jgi:hypothetical protein
LFPSDWNYKWNCSVGGWDFYNCAICYFCMVLLKHNKPLFLTTKISYHSFIHLFMSSIFFSFLKKLLIWDRLHVILNATLSSQLINKMRLLIAVDFWALAEMRWNYKNLSTPNIIIYLQLFIFRSVFIETVQMQKLAFFYFILAFSHMKKFES